MTTLKQLPSAQHAIIMEMAAGATLHYSPGYVFHNSIIKPKYELHTGTCVRTSNSRTARRPSVEKLGLLGYLAEMTGNRDAGCTLALSELGQQYAAQFAA